MRSSKSRSRNKSNRQRSLGNVVNRVFDSSGPEGKVRGTPQQIIEKYLTLARDAQLSNDRVAEQSFLQHAEHYTRLLGEAQREMAERQQQYQQNQRSGGDDDRDNGGRQYGGRDNGHRENGNGQRENGQFENTRDTQSPQNYGQQDGGRASALSRPASPLADRAEQPDAAPEENTVRKPRSGGRSRQRTDPSGVKDQQAGSGLPDAFDSENQPDPVQLPESESAEEAPAKAPRKRKTPAAKTPAKSPRKRKSDGEDAGAPPEQQPGDAAE